MFNILVIEDNKNMRKLICATLKQNGYSTFEAEDGEVGLDVLDTTHIDLIICDIMMPNMNGETCLQNLQKIDSFSTPVIALTADAIVGAKEKYLKEGFCDYISKPFNKEQIKEKLDKVFTESENIGNKIDWNNVPKYYIGD